MKRFKNVLVVPAEIDAADPALSRALRLAEVNEARLRVVWPIDESNGQLETSKLTDTIVAGAREQLEAMVNPLRAGGVPIETDVAVGRPFIQLIARVLRHDHDLIMKTARGRNALRQKVFFGTTALHLLRKCPCPVWIINPDSLDRQGGVLVAIDPDTENETTLTINRMLMELGTSLAERQGRDLHVLHVWNVPYGDLVRHSPWLRVSKTEVDSYFTEIRDRHAKRFEELVASFRPVAPSMKEHFYEGIPEEVILDLAREKNIEVIVMATLARSGIPGLMIGNTAENVLGVVDCSVLTVKPADFVSPVQAEQAQ